MTERYYVRQINDTHWQWRAQLADGSWHEEVRAGTLELLAESIGASTTPVCLLMPGHKAVVRSVPVEGVEKKHLAKLVPYDMEEQLVDAVEDLHFCFGSVEDEHVNLIYLDSEVLRNTLEEILLTRCEVQQVFPEYLLLSQEQADGTLVLEGDFVIAKFGQGRGFSIESTIAPIVLDSLKNELELEEATIRIVAESEEELSELRSCLPEAWANNENIEIFEQVGSYWDCIDATTINSPLNLRSGQFGRQLPISKWWSTWQTASYYVAAAFVFALVVNYGGYLSAKNQGKEIRKQIEQVYFQALPKGRKGDEERRLESELKKNGGASSSDPTNLMVLLSALSKSMDQQKDVQLSNFRYNGEQREMQVKIEVKGLSELGKFRDVLASNGVQTQSPRTNKNGEIYEANMKLSEN